MMEIISRQTYFWRRCVLTFQRRQMERNRRRFWRKWARARVLFLFNDGHHLQPICRALLLKKLLCGRSFALCFDDTTLRARLFSKNEHRALAPNQSKLSRRSINQWHLIWHRHHRRAGSARLSLAVQTCFGRFPAVRYLLLVIFQFPH